MSRPGIARLGGALSLCLLASCGGGSGNGDSGDTSGPGQTARSLGLMEITISGLGTSAMTSHMRMVAGGQVAHSTAQPTPMPLGLDVQQASATSTSSGGMRYVNVVYNVRNAQFCNTPGSCTAYTSATHNLTLIGANTAGNINSTALTKIALFDGSSSTTTQALATSVLPTHGMQFNAGAGSGVMVTPGLASLQVYSESEVSSASIPRDTGATDLFPFGYVVSNINTPGSRSLPANPAANQWDGEVAFSFKIPLQSDSTQDPYSISMIFQVIDDANTRVTQSVEEQNYPGDLAAALRASILGGSDVAVLGGRVAQMNDGDPICTVRTAGTAAAPSATLANNGATNSGATLASVPANPGLGDTLQFGFCTPMTAPGATALAISGSMSGTHAGTYSTSGNMVSFAPAKPFLPGETVSYTATTGVQSSGGTALAAPWTGSFMPGAAARVASSGTFALQSPALAASAPAYVAVADFDGDGLPDIAVLNPSTHVVTIYPGSGGATFGVTMGSATQSLVAGDFNGDGRPDLAATNENVNGSLTNPKIVIYVATNAGNQAFTSTSITGTLMTVATNLVVGDFNHDGFDDIALAGVPGGGLTTYLGSPSGLVLGHRATVGVNFAPQPGVKGLVVADFNGDGVPDIALLLARQQIETLIGKGDGSFDAPVLTTLTGVGNGTTIVAADFNGDGRPDLAFGSNDGQVAILLNTGNTGTTGGNFNASPTSTVTFALPYDIVDLAAGDFDGNGTADLAMSSSTTSGTFVTILPNDGTGNFTVGSTVNLSSGAFAFDMAVLDLNNDGRLDLVAPTSKATTLDVLLGQP